MKRGVKKCTNHEPKPRLEHLVLWIPRSGRDERREMLRRWSLPTTHTCRTPRAPRKPDPRQPSPPAVARWAAEWSRQEANR